MVNIDDFDQRSLGGVVVGGSLLGVRLREWVNQLYKDILETIWMWTRYQLILVNYC